MTIALGSVSNSANVSDTGVTWQHTVLAGENIIIVCVQAQDSNSNEITTSSVTFNGDALTSVGNSPLGSGYIRTDIWYLVNPDVVTNGNIVVTKAGKCTDIMCSAISLSGVDTSDPIDKPAPAAATSTNPTVTVLCRYNNSWIVDAMVTTLSATTSIAVDANGTQMNKTDVGSYACCSSYRAITGAAGNYAIGWTADSAEWVTLVVAFKADISVAIPRMGFVNFANGPGQV